MKTIDLSTIERRMHAARDDIATLPGDDSGSALLRSSLRDIADSVATLAATLRALQSAASGNR